MIGFQTSGYHPTPKSPKSIISKDCCIEFLRVLTSPLLGSCYRHHCQFDGWLTRQVCPTHLLEGAAKRIFVSSSACGPDASVLKVLNYPPGIERGNEDPPFINECLIQTPIHGGFSIATFDYQRVAPKRIVNQ